MKLGHQDDEKKFIKEIFDEIIILKYVSVTRITVNHI